MNGLKLPARLKSLDDFLKMPKGHRPIVAIYAVEGAHSLGLETTSAEGALKNLEALFNRGVASLTLGHFYPNLVVHPTYPFPDDVAKLSVHPGMWRDLTLGLTETGKQVVEKMIELGMMIDISHSSPVARKEIYDIIDASGRRVPLFATHVGAYELDPTPYNLTDWEIKRIARDGGVIGVIFMPYWLMPKESAQGLNFVSRHMQYLVNVGGVDSVGIGTDFDGFATPPEDLDNASRMPRLRSVRPGGHPHTSHAPPAACRRPGYRGRGRRRSAAPPHPNSRGWPPSCSSPWHTRCTPPPCWPGPVELPASSRSAKDARYPAISSPPGRANRSGTNHPAAWLCEKARSTRSTGQTQPLAERLAQRVDTAPAPAPPGRLDAHQRGAASHRCKGHHVGVEGAVHARGALMLGRAPYAMVDPHRRRDLHARQPKTDPRRRGGDEPGAHDLSFRSIDGGVTRV